MIHASQVGVPSTGATLLAVIPPGPVVAVLTNAATAATVYFGAATVTISSGHPIPPATTITLPAMDTSSGGVLYGIASAGTVPTGVTLVTDN